MQPVARYDRGTVVLPLTEPGFINGHDVHVIAEHSGNKLVMTVFWHISRTPPGIAAGHLRVHQSSIPWHISRAPPGISVGHLLAYQSGTSWHISREQERTAALHAYQQSVEQVSTINGSSSRANLPPQQQQIKRRLETLEKYWIEFQNNDQKLRQYEIGEHEYFAQDYLNNAEKMYNDVKEYIQSFIRANYTKPSSPLQKPKFQWPQVPVSTEMGAIPKTPSNQQSTSGNLEYLLRKQRSNFKFAVSHAQRCGVRVFDYDRKQCRK
ncbi:unnamed protein product [Plutella xylostella]|uniref:(diamondback moth) hypothetical protein n=1 Tax=Plutella xylostella TaxID=51655 RepID=A0A8S4GGN3_PLUXY|nr:unnamed protein product [Plutella xylostella]